jgi:hypothetical protein
VAVTVLGLGLDSDSVGVGVRQCWVCLLDVHPEVGVAKWSRVIAEAVKIVPAREVNGGTGR